ncbi:MAG TPA: ATP-dependent DNA helicase [Bryobacteraceae bacterium]|nr:ATP-dependent DNA helicase [Bryobacteraceae bacterium]
MTVAEDALRANLNDEQYRAAIDPSAQVLTLACAGSGKSRTLAYRIAWLIADRGATPEGIVAFTFTEKAADSIKLRVSAALAACELDTNLLGRMYIGTIHSYCQYLLGRADARYRQFEVLDDNRLKLYLIEKYGLLQLNRFRPRANDRYFAVIGQCHDAWTHHNEEMLDPATIEPHDPDLAAYCRDLRERLIADQFLDFSLMQRLVVDALQNRDPGILDSVRQLQHLLVDEYQDINPIQEALIGLLHQNCQTLFVVGDDDQSIYGWRGADVTRIQTFTDRFPAASTHTLARNYRSTPLIVSNADAFAHAELGANRIVKNPQADDTDQPNEFRNLWFGTRAEEADWVANKIASLLGTAYREPNGTVRGLTPADFAILMRSTRTAETGGNPPRHVPFTSRLSDRGILFSLEAGGGLFDRPQVQLLRAAFELLRNGQPDRNIVRQFFDQQVTPLFPRTDFNDLTGLFATWGRDIHAPTDRGVPRRRIYPQKLVFDLLNTFDVANTPLDDAILQDIGVFSRIIQDVEAVYPSVDSTMRFTSILNFLNVVAEDGYDTSSSDIVQRPDAVTVSTVHKMKGLEFPVVFVVDVENQRFPGKRRNYGGWLPAATIQDSLNRGAYQSRREDEARLFYTALTRAERFLYVTGSANAPGWGRPKRPSPFAAHLADARIVTDATAATAGLVNAPPARRIEASNLPTSYSDIRYYLRCPKDYHYRRIFGFSPSIPDLFGFGMTVHASIGKLHQQFPAQRPTAAQAEAVVQDIFHLKHVQQSNDPVGRPGPYERARTRAQELVSGYAQQFSTDFERRREVEARFEIPVNGAVVSGAIDLMLEEDENGNVVDACVVDFKTLGGGDDPLENADLEWTELALQVQLYAKAARDVLGHVADEGFVHLLKDGQRLQVPVGDAAVGAALANVEWAVDRIVASDFPMRPHRTKCEDCDFNKICPMRPQNFAGGAQPPPIHVPPDGQLMIPAFRSFDADFTGLD